MVKREGVLPSWRLGVSGLLTSAVQSGEREEHSSLFRRRHLPLVRIVCEWGVYSVAGVHTRGAIETGTVTFPDLGSDFRPV